MRTDDLSQAPADSESQNLLGILLVQAEPSSPRLMMPLARDVAVPAAIWTAPTPWAALQLIRRRPGAFGLCIVTDELGDVDPLDFLRRLRREAPGMPALLVRAAGSGAVYVPPEGGDGTGDAKAIRELCSRFRGRRPAA